MPWCWRQLRFKPVSYVSPVRELSVVIGAWIGVRFMASRAAACGFSRHCWWRWGSWSLRWAVDKRKVVVIYKRSLYIEEP